MFEAVFPFQKSYAQEGKSCLQNAYFYIQKGPLFETPFEAFKLDWVSFSSSWLSCILSGTLSKYPCALYSLTRGEFSWGLSGPFNTEKRNLS